jgi:F-type H+-transporting ATPase subunit epsilon
MSTHMHVELIVPEDLLFSGEAEMVQAPGAEGEFGVLPGHAPMVVLLQPGLVKIRGLSHENRVVFITGGVAEITAAGCVILADALVDLETVTREDVNQRMADAEEALRAAVGNEVARGRAEKEMRLAQTIKSIKWAH